MRINHVKFSAIFKVEGEIPDKAMQCQRLFDAATLLQQTGIDITQWKLTAETKKDALKLAAFTQTGPTPALLEQVERGSSDKHGVIAIWNGVETYGAASVQLAHQSNGRVSFEFSALGFEELKTYNRVADLLERLLALWKPEIVEVGPTKYYLDSAVFPDHPGVGWMLYLPRRIGFEQVPEAHMIRHVKDLNGTEGTIIISEIDGPFDADNPDHVKVANAIEIRLADQDLLPRYIDL